MERDNQSKQILNDQHKEFEPIAIKFRQRWRIFTAFLLLGVVSFIIASIVSLSSSAKSGWFIGFYMLCILLGLITVFFFFPKLRCPKCSSDAALGPDFYCPECGGSHLSKPNFFFGRKCGDCGKSLRNGRSRNYRIHYCQNCGAYLDEQGL